VASTSRPRFFANASLVTTSAPAPSFTAGCVARGRRPLRVEDRLQGGELLQRRVPARALVGDDLADRHDLVREAALLLRRCRALVRAQCPLVLRLPRDAELARDERRLLDHVATVEGGRQPVVHHQVDQRAVAEL
jgi:hypothetical protein